jgi:predicted ATPase/class 3 adenylate cyclase
METDTALPTGTITFLLTDIEGSTRLWEEHPELMGPVVARHDAIVTSTVEERGGIIIRGRREGDSFFAVFARATDAVAAAADLQRALLAEPWPAPISLRVRAGINTGEAELRRGEYYGSSITRCARIRALGAGGQTLLGRTTYELVRDALPPRVRLRDLGSHQLKDLQHPEQVFQLSHPDLPTDFPPLKSLNTLPHNLPIQLTSFIGRESEMEEVQRLLGATRLLTLTGAGGTGKTRLALQVAAELLSEYPEGAWFVDLSPLTEGALVPQAVAAVLSVREEPGRPAVQTLVEALQARKLLLLLDNCEHLLPACGELVTALLRRCPGVRVLATSREGLGITGEQLYRAPSLALPEHRPGAVRPAPDALLQYEAVRLFGERARASLPSFTVTNANAAAVAEVCHRLDGIPLALELAAARVRVLSVEQIRVRLDDCFRLLTGGSRAALPRQQTLRAAIDWSYELLTEAERALLRRLSVFAGGFTLEAAEAVWGDAEEILDLLSQLVDKSLVLLEETPEPRYRLLETIRQYGQEHLRAASEETLCRRRHRDWFQELVGRAEPELRGARQGEWLERLERDHDNLRAALAWSMEAGAPPAGTEPSDANRREVEAGLRLGASLGYFWHVRGYLTEGRERVAALLALSEAPTPLRAQALSIAGVLAFRQGEYETARSLHQESLEIKRGLGDRRGMAQSLNNLAIVAMDQGKYDVVRSLLEECIAIDREFGEERNLALSLNNLGNLAYEQGERGEARALYEESLAIKRRMGDRQGIANSLVNLGNLALQQGERGVARSLYQESLEIQRELGDKRGIATALYQLGTIAQDQGEDEAAQALYAQSLGICRNLGDQLGIAKNLAGLAGVEGARGQADRAARLFGAAEALRDTLGAPLSPRGRERVEEHSAGVRASLGEEAFVAAWAAGRAMSLEAAIAVALSDRDVPED